MAVLDSSGVNGLMYLSSYLVVVFAFLLFGKRWVLKIFWLFLTILIWSPRGRLESYNLNLSPAMFFAFLADSRRARFASICNATP